MFDHVKGPNDVLRNFEQGNLEHTLEDLIFDEQVKMFMNSFYSQFHFGCFYS